MMVIFWHNDVILWAAKGPSWGDWIGQPSAFGHRICDSLINICPVRSPCVLRCCCWWIISNSQQTSSLFTVENNRRHRSAIHDRPVSQRKIHSSIADVWYLLLYQAELIELKNKTKDSENKWSFMKWCRTNSKGC